MLGRLPNEILLMINDHMPLVKDKAYSASVNKCFHRLFQPEIGKKEAEDAAACAIYPTKENVEKLKALLEACPALLLHQMTVKNRHVIKIKGTVYQIALHEGDNELIDDLIKPAFMSLHQGLEKMEEQRKEWFPKDWLGEEEKAIAPALAAIDNVFTAFKNASHLKDVTELPRNPYTITINDNNARTALEVVRKAIDALYQATDKVITSGRDPIIRLLEHVIDQYLKNYNACGGDDSPRNKALIRSLYGYCQRFAPINFMQAFAQGVYYIVEGNKLIRSFEYRYWWTAHAILPLDPHPQFRLGNKYFVSPSGSVSAVGWRATFFPKVGCSVYKTFYQSKTAALQIHTCRDQSKTLIGKGSVQ